MASMVPPGSRARTTPFRIALPSPGRKDRQVSEYSSPRVGQPHRKSFQPLSGVLRLGKGGPRFEAAGRMAWADAASSGWIAGAATSCPRRIWK